MPKPFRLALTIALLIVCADQATKQLAAALLEYGIPIPIFTGFNLTLLHNTGAAFSFLHDAAGWQRWFFTGIAFVVSIGILFWLRALDPTERWGPAALALILGGAIGNLVDRVLLGYVIDFIQLYYGRWSWPAFNVADSAISIGAVMLLLRGPRYPERKTAD